MNEIGDMIEEQELAVLVLHEQTAGRRPRGVALEDVAQRPAGKRAALALDARQHHAGLPGLRASHVACRIVDRLVLLETPGCKTNLRAARKRPAARARTHA